MRASSAMVRRDLERLASYSGIGLDEPDFLEAALEALVPDYRGRRSGEDVHAWRVERPRLGDGPYGPATSSFDLEEMSYRLGRAHWNDDHPGPTQDDIRLIRRAPAMFACTSLEAAREWFDGWGRRLERYGFRLSHYVVDSTLAEVGRSGRQLVFIRPAARLVERMALTEAGIR